MTTKTLVLVSGVFDLFHRGHVELINRAAGYGDELVVSVNSDAMVERYKRRPVFSQDDRLAIVGSMRCVSQAIIYGEFDLKPLVELFRPAVMVHGDDWPRGSYLEQIRMTEDDLTHFGLELVLVPYWRGTSTTAIVNRLRAPVKSLSMNGSAGHVAG